MAPEDTGLLGTAMVAA